MGGGRPRGAWLAALQRRTRTAKRVGRRAGRVDREPVDMAKIVSLLLARNAGNSPAAKAADVRVAVMYLERLNRSGGFHRMFLAALPRAYNLALRRGRPPMES